MSAAPGVQRTGRYVDGIRVPWWLGDARVHNSDAAILFKKNAEHYSKFQEHYGAGAGQYTEVSGARA